MILGKTWEILKDSQGQTFVTLESIGKALELTPSAVKELLHGKVSYCYGEPAIAPERLACFISYLAQIHLHGVASEIMDEAIKGYMVNYLR